MKKTTQLSIVMALTLICSRLSAQDPGLNRLNEIATRYYQQLQQEQQPLVWLHTDRSIYLPGESIWFSAYFIQGTTHQAWRKDPTLYVALQDESGVAVSQLRLYSAEETLTGTIALPDSLPEGHYQIIAYTPGMRNSPVPLSFPKELLVIKNGLPQRKQQRQMPVAQSFRFTVAVEGGTLISGVSNRVVCNAVDENGNPVRATGIVTNAIDTNRIYFNTNDLGFAAFSIPAVHNRKYTVTLSYSGKTWSEILLPSPAAGWQLSLTERKKDRIKVRISLSDSLYKVSPLSYIVAVAAGKVRFAASGKGMYEAEIPLAEFPQGLASIGLYNERGELVSSRPFFLDQQQLTIELKPNMAAFAAHDPVNLGISFMNAAGKPVRSRFSVSVSPAAFTTTERDEASYLRLLTFREWFMDKNYSREQLATLLASDEWLDAVTLLYNPGNWTYKTEPLSPITLQGKLADLKDNILPDQVVTLFASKGGNLVLTDTTDTEGRFSFSLPDFMGSVTTNLQVSEKGKVRPGVKMEFTPAAIPAAPDLNPVFLNDPIGGHEAFLEAIRQPQYQEVRFRELPVAAVNSRKNEVSENIARRRMNKGSWIATPEMIDNMGDGSLANVLLGAPGVQLMGGFITIQGGVRNLSGASGPKTEPMVVVNGVMMNLGGDGGQFGMSVNISPVMNFINSFSNRNVDFIEVLNGSQAAQYGTNGANGVILIYTSANARNGINEEKNKNMVQYQTEGYHVAPAFPSPDYAEPIKKGALLPDHRKTLYWNGQVQTDTQGTARIKFFMPDEAVAFYVTISGVADDGTLFSRQFLVNGKKGE